MSFTSFKQLPPEIRIMIWKAALQGPSLFGDHLAIERVRNLENLQQYNAFLKVKSNLAALFVDSESRRTALKQIAKVSDVGLKNWPVRNSTSDYGNDVAVVDFFHTRLGSSSVTRKDAVEWNKITRLIVMDCPDRFDLGEGPAYLRSVLEWLLRLPSLKETALVIGVECSCEDDHVTVISGAGQVVRVYGGCESEGWGPDILELYVETLEREFTEMAEEVAAAR